MYCKLRLQYFLFVLLLGFFSLAPYHIQAQGEGTALIYGKVVDSTGDFKSVKNVKVRVNSQVLAITDSNGQYKALVAANKPIKIEFVYLNKIRKTINLDRLSSYERKNLDVHIDLTDLIIVDYSGQSVNPFTIVTPIDNFYNMPNITGGVEGLVKLLPGVSSNDELSSQYSVRGGNFDENLVYINDIEIFRPMLIRSGQEEGLSIINPDLVKNLEFSAGGFDAKYGDKLSSVLNIQYREPDTLRGTTSASLLGSSASLGALSKNKKFSFIAGARYRTNSYLLNSLDVQGDYQTNFGDAQALFTYSPTKKLKFAWLSYYGSNNYLSVPQTQETTFGTVSSVIRLMVYFQGRQLLQYHNFLNGFTTTYNFNKHNSIKFIASIYTSTEAENFDIIGQYSLQQLDNDLGSKSFGKAKYTLGAGGYLNHARNSLYSLIYNTEIKGENHFGKQLNLAWGIKAQHEEIEDHLSEYKYIDSADFSVPQTANRHILPVNEYIYTENYQNWNRYMGYAQNSFTISKKDRAYLNTGVRFNYWDYNNELLISPRMQFAFEPNARHNAKAIKLQLDSDIRNYIRLKAAIGVYNQPPFYRELRGLDGTLNPEIRAQKSVQFLLGNDMTFKAWGRKFKFTAEAYYKHLTDIIPYELDDVRIRYLATNNAIGYATGMDFQLYGDIVKDLPSWISLSFMKTAENLNNDQYTVTDPTTGISKTVYPGYIPRPTDQRVRVSMFFQDFLRGNPTNKVHLNLVYGSGLPFGPPIHKRYADTLTLPPYRRVDIGFSKLLFDKHMRPSNSRFLNHFRSIWLSAEVFNMFQINNTVAYLWVQDVSGSEWAVPRYLTGRRLNVRLEVKF